MGFGSQPHLLAFPWALGDSLPLPGARPPVWKREQTRPQRSASSGRRSPLWGPLCVPSVPVRHTVCWGGRGLFRGQMEAPTGQGCIVLFWEGACDGGGGVAGVGISSGPQIWEGSW